MDTLLQRLLCCFGARHLRGHPRQHHGGGRDVVARDNDNDKRGFLRRATRPSGAARFGHSADVERLNAPRPRRRRWPRVRGMNRVFARSPTARPVEPMPVTDATTATAVKAEGGASSEEISAEHAAAVTIQAHFRGHLVRADIVN